jgi:hypothetical protein
LETIREHALNERLGLGVAILLVGDLRAELHTARRGCRRGCGRLESCQIDDGVARRGEIFSMLPADLLTIARGQRLGEADERIDGQQCAMQLGQAREVGFASEHDGFACAEFAGLGDEPWLLPP